MKKLLILSAIAYVSVASINANAATITLNEKTCGDAQIIRSLSKKVSIQQSVVDTANTTFKTEECKAERKQVREEKKKAKKKEVK